MQNKQPMMKLGPIVIDCGEGGAGKLAEFYSKLLDWEITHPPQNGWAAITSLDGKVVAFQEVKHYQSPVWPWEASKQGQMIHLDFIVDDLQDAIAYAIGCGATLLPQKYFDDSRTLLDPEGHPFCLDTFKD